jgi:hypothetical protein
MRRGCSWKDVQQRTKLKMIFKTEKIDVSGKEQLGFKKCTILKEVGGAKGNLSMLE